MGLDIGLEAAGLRVVVALERDPAALATIRANRPDLALIDRPIEEVATAEILSAGGLGVGQPFAVVGGPSCQVFSTAGRRESLADPRGTMFDHFVRVIREARPSYFVMENVPGLISAAIRHRPLSRRGPGFPPLQPEEELGSGFAVLVEALRQLGYYAVFDVLNTADYGVPQIRRRLVIIGSREGKRLRFPEPTHDRYGLDGRLPWATLGDALRDWEDSNPEYCRFPPSRRRYLELVPEGGNWRDLPAQLQGEALGGAFSSWGGRSGFCRRLAFARPSPALTTRPDSKATTLCHPTELRPLTVGEYARIQQFPDDWVFEGSLRQKYAQIGNAVPVGLGTAIGLAIRTTSRTHARPNRLSRVECLNFALLSRLARRPRTVLNPPRMRHRPDVGVSRCDSSKSKREDAFEYAPPELVNRLRRLVVR